MKRLLLIGMLASSAALSAADSNSLRMNLRSRVEAFRGSGEWQEVRFEKNLPVAETAILICDMWDNHWCKGASRRVDGLVKTRSEERRVGKECRL